jgi:methyl-accepting chemotaxis protein
MRARLLIQILPVVALAIAALTAVAVTAASSAQRDAVYGEMSELIGREASRFDGRAQADMAAARNLAAALEADPSISREHGRDVVRRYAERRPELLGVWAAFEPDAYDGRDADHRGADPLGDPAGRFAVWAQRIDGPLKVEASRTSPTTRGPTTTTTSSRSRPAATSCSTRTSTAARR